MLNDLRSEERKQFSSICERQRDIYRFLGIPDTDGGIRQQPVNHIFKRFHDGRPVDFLRLRDLLTTRFVSQIRFAYEWFSLWKALWAVREQNASRLRPLISTQLDRLARFHVAGSDDNYISLWIHNSQTGSAAENTTFSNSDGTWLINDSDPAEAILSELAACLQKESAAPLAPDRPIVEINLSAPQLEVDGSSSHRNILHTFFCAGPALLSMLEQYITAPEEPQPIPVN